MNKLKGKLEDMKECPGCYQAVDDSDTDGQKTTDNVQKAKSKHCDKTEKDSPKSNFVKRENLTGKIDTKGQDSVEFRSVYSSVWCHDGVNQVCQFENICYNSAAEEFLLFQHESSTFEHVKIEGGSITVDVSAIKDHNAQQTTIVSLSSDTFSRFNATWINKTTLVFKPFLPDNLMHMFHDDIIPLHHTLKLITMDDKHSDKNNPFDVQLFIFDDKSAVDSEVEKFYAVFSKFKIKSKENFEDGVTCFKSIFIGLSKTTTWYDYGFTNPQGPLLNYEANSRHVRSTVEHIRQQLPLPSRNFNTRDFMVLFERKENRKLINEMELTLDIIKTVGMKVIILNYDSYSLSDLISYVSHSRGIIAMHGALLVLSMFLKPGSFVIELFPYAINPSNYTPYKTLSELNGMGLVYKAWTNRFQANTIAHPEWPPDYGGLNHLKDYERQIILEQTNVPPHICCKDPSWLYHIYQDTVVDCADISALVNDALTERRTKIKEANNSGYLFHPSKVQNVSCIFSNNSGKQEEHLEYVLNIQWSTPWTMSYNEVEEMHYEILLQDFSADSAVTSYRSAVNKLVINVDSRGVYYVWVRCVTRAIASGLYSNALLCQKDLS